MRALLKHILKLPSMDVAGIAFGAIPIGVRLFQSAAKISNNVSSIWDLGDELKRLDLDFRIEKQIFSKWRNGCGLAELAKYDPVELDKHDPGREKEEYQVLLDALTRMSSYLASAQLLIEYVNAGTNVSSPNLHAAGTSDFIPHMRRAGLGGRSSEVEWTPNELQAPAANINSQVSATKKVRRGLTHVKDLKQLIDNIRQLNISLEKLRPSTRETAQGKLFPNRTQLDSD